MTPVTLDSGEYLMVDTPDGAHDFQIEGKYKDKLCFHIEEPNPIHPWPTVIILPVGEFEIVGIGNELTDEQWSGIVDCKLLVMFPDYTKKDFYFDYPTASGLSLIQHHGMKPNCVILKKSHQLK